jgi:hypothetical protein
MQVLSMTHHLIIVTICSKYLQNPLIYEKIRKLWTGHDIYPQIDNVDYEWAIATLTLVVGVWLLHTKNRLIITNICAKFFQTPLMNDKVMVRTRKCDGRMDGRSNILGLWPIFFVMNTRQSRSGRLQLEGIIISVQIITFCHNYYVY